MKNLLIAIFMSSTLLLLSAFTMFSAFRFMDRKEDLPERIFFIAISILCFLLTIIAFVGITQIGG